ncbi:MAG: Ig-like domain-containing protein [Butyrivibrio sp.]|nr:Ig-like domain-containing protein [Butyrivibrio sp.]
MKHVLKRSVSLTLAVLVLLSSADNAQAASIDDFSASAESVQEASIEDLSNAVSSGTSTEESSNAASSGVSTEDASNESGEESTESENAADSAATESATEDESADSGTESTESSAEGSSDAALLGSSDDALAGASASSSAASSSSSEETSEAIFAYTGEYFETYEDFNKKYPTGHIELSIPVQAQSVLDGSSEMDLMSEADSYGSYYVNTNLPALRNQAPYGTCWAFATTALAEINLMKTGTMSSPDMSELHLAYFTSNSVGDPLGGTDNDIISLGTENALDAGGNGIFALSTFDRWMGVADESIAKYSDAGNILSTGLSSDIAYEDVAHVVNYYVEPISTDKNIIATTKHAGIKKMIHDYGAASISFFAADGFSPVTSGGVFNSSTNAYYNPEVTQVNHEVVVVGWDDNFSKNNFAVTPPGDGAFLVRNSWRKGNGTAISDNMGYDGYFWMSYYEGTLGNEAYAAEFELADNYDNNYEYDGASYKVYWYGAYKAANVFTAKADGGGNGERLDAVSFYTTSSNVDYTIEIYTNLTDDSSPVSGTKVGSATTTGTTTYTGFYTVQLDDAVILSPGTKFSVVVTLKSDDDEPPLIANAYEINGGKATVSAGESFIAFNSGWMDLSNFSDGKVDNICIKAFTNNIESTEEILPEDIEFYNLESDPMSVGVGESVTVKAKILPANATDRKVNWTSSDTAIATVSKSGTVTGVAAGTATITAKSNSGNVSKSYTVKVVNKLLGLGIKPAKSYNEYRSGNTYTFTAVNTPSTYISSEEVIWSTSTPEIVSVVSKNGNCEVTVLSAGVFDITASLEGIIATYSDEAYPSENDYKFTVNKDNSVTLWWKKIPQAEVYVVAYANEAGEFIENEVYYDDSAYILNENEYEYTFTNCQNDYTKSSCVYGFGYVIDGYLKSVTYDIKLNKTATITYVVGDGVLSNDSPSFYVIGYETKLIEPTPPKGYDFDGWYLDSKYTESKLRTKILATDKDNLKLYAKYSVITNKVYFDAQDGSDPVKVKVNEGDVVEKPADPVREGYKFVGWYTDKACTTGNEYDFSQPVTASELYLYGKWHAAPLSDDYGYEVDKYNNVTFWWNAIDGASTYSIKKDNKTLKTVTENGKSKYEYAYTAYKNNYSVISEKFILEYVIESITYSVPIEVTFNKTATITYVLGSGTQNSSNPDIYVVGYETKIYDAIPADGRVFDGWYKYSDYSGNKVSSISASDSENIVLYAKYTKLKQTVTFNKNNADSVKTFTVQVEYGDTVIKPFNPEYTGYKFAGWYIDSACTDGNEFDFEEKVTKDFTLYAKWVADVFSISIMKYDNSATDFVPNEIIAGDSITLTAQVRTAGDTDKGFDWYNYGEDSSVVYADIYPTGAATVTVNSKGNLVISALKAGTVKVTAVSQADTSITDSKTIAIKEINPQRIKVVAEKISGNDISSDAAYGIYISKNENLQSRIKLSYSAYNDTNKIESPDQSVTVSCSEYLIIEKSGDGYVIIKPDESKIDFDDDTSIITAPVTFISDADELVTSEYDVIISTADNESDIEIPELQIISSGKDYSIYGSSNPATDIDEDGIRLAAGKSVGLKALLNIDSSDKSIEWFSENTSVATVSSSGKISAKGAGEVVISAIYVSQNIKASARVVVYDPVTSFAIDKKSLKLGKNQSAYINITALLPVTASSDITIVSDNTKVATATMIDEKTVLVSSGNAGKANITLKTANDEKTAKCSVTVGNSVESISVIAKGVSNGADAAVAVGKTIQMQAVFNGGNKSSQPVNKEISWEILESSCEGVATVNEKGIIKAEKEGWIRVVAKSTTDVFDDDYVTSEPVTVYTYVQLKKASINPNTVTLAPGKSYTLNATVLSTVTGHDVTGSSLLSSAEDELVWKCKNSVDEGYITIVPSDDDPATCVVSVPSSVNVNRTVPVVASFKAYNAKKATTMTCNINITTGALKKIQLSSTKLSLNRGAEGIVSAKLTPMVPEESGVVWEITDQASKNLICLVDEDGNEVTSITTDDDAGAGANYIRVKVLSTGATNKAKAYITATTVGVNSKNKTLSAKVIVEIGNEAKDIRITSGKNDVTWISSASNNNNKLLQIAEKKSVALKAVVYNKYVENAPKSCIKAGNQKITWQSSDESVATVNASGKVTAVGTGEAYITAYSTDINYEDGSNLTGEPKVSAKALVYVYAAANKIALDKNKATLGTGISTGQALSSMRQYDVITPVLASESIFTNAGISAGLSDKKATIEYDMITWQVDSGTDGKELIAVAAIDTNKINSVRDAGNKQKLIGEYDSEFVPISPKSEVSVFTTGSGEALAIKALRAGTVKITATAPGGKKAVCTVTINTHVENVTLKLDWPDDTSENKLYSYDDPVQKVVTVNKQKYTVNVIEKLTEAEKNSYGGSDYVARLDLKSIKSTKLVPVLDYYAGVSDDGSGNYVDETCYYSDKSGKKFGSVQNAATSSYKSLKKFVANQTVYYKSSDSSIVKVDAKGTMTANASGKAYITITTADRSKSITVCVVVSKTAGESVNQ